VLGVPYAGGSYGISSSDSGPLGIRLSLDAATGGPHDLGDLGDIRFLPGPPTDDMLAPYWLSQVRAARFGDPQSPLPVCMLSAAEAVTSAAAAAGLPLIVLGGDHSVSVAALSGAGRRRAGLLHVDAHGDLSTGRDGLRLLHSSWVWAADQAVSFAALAQVGVADGSVLPSWLAGRARRWGPEEVGQSPAVAAEQVIEFFASRGCRDAYVSIDIDALTQQDAPATGLPDGAIPVQALASFLESLAGLTAAPGAPRYFGADVTEVAPTLAATSGRPGEGDWAQEATCRSAAELVSRLAVMLSGSVHDIAA